MPMWDVEGIREVNTGCSDFWGMAGSFEVGPDSRRPDKGLRGRENKCTGEASEHPPSAFTKPALAPVIALRPGIGDMLQRQSDLLGALRASLSPFASESDLPFLA